MHEGFRCSTCVRDDLAADVNKIYSQFEREMELDSGRIRVIVALIRLSALYVSLTSATFAIATDILTPYEYKGSTSSLAL